jgi:mono/diheme cytochrome c family protein
MRRLFSIVIRAAALLVAVIGLLLGTIYILSNTRLRRVYHVAVVPPALPFASGSPEAGRHIAVIRGCTQCHGNDLGGAKVIDDPAMGRIFGPNLTRGHGGPPEPLTDDDFIRAIRHGIAPDGHGLFLMPSGDFARITDIDMADLVAFVRSVPAVDRESVPLRIGPVSRALLLAGKIRLAADEIDHNALRPDVVEPGPTVAYGRYLAVGCTGCHGPNYSGGKIEAGPPSWPHAANLTPDPSGHLSHWTEADFFAALRTRRRPDGTQIDPVMPAVFGQMSDVELKAIWRFLKTLPPVPTGTR